MNKDGDYLVFTCKFLKLKQAEEGFCRMSWAESMEDKKFRKEQSRNEKVKVLNIELENATKK